MDRSNANILFSILLGVALFLFIAYSAVKTIDSTPPDNYFVVSQGVDFHDGIANAPTQTTYAKYEQGDVSIPEYSPNNDSYTASGIETTSEARRLELANNSGGAGSTNKSNESTGSNSGMTVVALNSGNHKDAATQDAAETTTSSLTTDGSLSSTATRQAAGGTSTNGGRDPGGKNPHNPIPVGDGLLFLLFLSGIYSLWKSAAKIKQLLTTSYFNLFSLKNKNVQA
jgi:hypothetical protein